MDFTLKRYGCLLTTLLDKNIRTYSVKDWYFSDKKGCVIRHDVDRKPYNALMMAQLEHSLEITSTYYFRMKSCSFHPEIIQKIQALGHEVGYHYENLSDCKGDYEKAWEQFQLYLSHLRLHADVQTIAMHGSPLSSFNNKDLWNKYDYKPLGIHCDALYDLNYTGMYYLTDTGRSWHHGSANLRDKVDNAQLISNVYSTKDLETFINLENNDLNLALVVHPERWDSTWSSWLIQKQKDHFINLVKLGIRSFRAIS